MFINTIITIINGTMLSRIGKRYVRVGQLITTLPKVTPITFQRRNIGKKPCVRSPGDTTAPLEPELSVEHSNLCFSWAKLCLESKEYDKAIRYYKKGIDTVRRNDFDVAIKHYEKEIANGNTKVYFQLGKQYFDRGVKYNYYDKQSKDLDNAEKNFRLAIDYGQFSGKGYSVFYSLGQLFYHKGNLQKSREYFRISCERKDHEDAPEKLRLVDGDIRWHQQWWLKD